jgi:tetratricopeptide (TPR) repeat protein
MTKLYRVFLFDTEEHYDELIAITTRAIQAEPPSGIALNNRRVAKWGLGLLDEALRDLSEAVREMPQSAVHPTRAGKPSYSSILRSSAS